MVAVRSGAEDFFGSVSSAEGYRWTPPQRAGNARPPRTPAPTSHATRRSCVARAFGWLLTFAGLLAALFCGVQGYRVSHANSRPIAELRPGQKVVTDASHAALAAADADPLLAGLPKSEQVDPLTWKLIRLRAELTWDDGTLDDVNVETLQPPEWLAENSIRVGGDAPIPLDLVEMGLPDDLRARVLEIAPCPPIQPGPGRIVLTTVNHSNADVLELTLRDARGRQDTVRTTSGHKFYSASRTAWLSAADLREGELLDGSNAPVTLTASRRLPGIHRVFNMTVQGDHVYRVGELRTLVHNDCLSYARSVLGRRPNGAIIQMRLAGVPQTGPLPGYPVTGLHGMRDRVSAYIHCFHLENGVLRDPAHPRGILVEAWLAEYARLNGMSITQVLDNINFLPYIP